VSASLLSAYRSESGSHAVYLAEEVIPTAPAPVLAEAWRGGSRQASLTFFVPNGPWCTFPVPAVRVSGSFVHRYM